MKNVLNLLAVSILTMVQLSCNNNQQKSASIQSDSKVSSNIEAVKDSLCIYEGVEYSQGSVTCQNGFEYVCDGGQWSRTGAKCDESKLYYTNSISVSKSKDSLIKLSKSFCVEFVQGTWIGKIPIRNTCNKPKQTTIIWSDKTESNYCVAPHKTCLIVPGLGQGRIIDEVDCSQINCQ